MVCYVTTDTQLCPGHSLTHAQGRLTGRVCAIVVEALCWRKWCGLYAELWDHADCKLIKSYKNLMGSLDFWNRFAIIYTGISFTQFQNFAAVTEFLFHVSSFVASQKWLVLHLEIVLVRLQFSCTENLKSLLCITARLLCLWNYRVYYRVGQKNRTVFRSL